MVILLYQVISYLSRPRDKYGLYFLLLLVLLLQNNIISGIVPDHRIHHPFYVQVLFGFGSSVLMSVYFPFYIYKFLDLKQIKFLATWGTILFLLLPYVVLFIIPVLVTHDVPFAVKLFIGPPIIYCIAFSYTFVKNIAKKMKDTIRNKQDSFFKPKAISVCIALAFWLCLPFVALFDAGQVTEHAVTNAGFFVMIIAFIRSNVRASRWEHDRLLKSEDELQKFNELLSQKVRERTLELEHVVEQKTTTFVNLTHEIRTPLTLIKNYLARVIEKYGKNDDLQVVQSNVETLIRDVNTFFQEEKFLKGMSTYNHNQLANFSQSLASKLIPFKSYALQKNITLTWEIGEHIHIKADPHALNSIVSNLVENAIKYTPANGSITVRLTADRDKARFSVKDTGNGIPADMQKKIFDPYFRLNKTDDNGMGMGLSIVDNCVKSLLGNIILNSKENEGSEFIVELSLFKIGEDSVGDDENIFLESHGDMAEVEDATGDMDKQSVLVIEDDYGMLVFLRDSLKEHYNVYVARNGRIALDRLKDIELPDLIISDVMMDEMDGIEFLRTIYGDLNYRHVPFLFLTANTTTNSKNAGYELGAIDYIQKPFDIHDLLMQVESIITNNRKHLEYVKDLAISNLKKSKPKKIKDKTVQLDIETLKQKRFEANCKHYNISDREKDILILLEKSLTRKEIGVNLFLAEKTVHKHFENIYRKVGVSNSNKLELIKKLYEE
jgi:signal transduction histidine kinase/DNA-binding NarL/FixJ family response regulator